MASKKDTMIDIGWDSVPVLGKSLIFGCLGFRRSCGLPHAKDLHTDLNFLSPTQSEFNLTKKAKKKKKKKCKYCFERESDIL